MSKDNEKEIKEKKSQDKKETKEEKAVEKKETKKEKVEHTEKEIKIDTSKKAVVSKEDTPKKKEVKKEREKKQEVVTENSQIHEKFMILGSYLLGKIKEYRYVMLLDIIVYLLLFFLIPKVIFDVSSVVWMIGFVVFTVLPTIGIYGMNKFRDKQILFSFFFVYVLILIFIKRFTIIELYGITSQGTLDHTPAWLDAVFVTGIIVFFQYIGILIVNVFKAFGPKSNNKKKKVSK